MSPAIRKPRSRCTLDSSQCSRIDAHRVNTELSLVPIATAHTDPDLLFGRSWLPAPPRCHPREAICPAHVHYPS